MPTQVAVALGGIIREQKAKALPCGVFGSFGCVINGAVEAVLLLLMLPCGFMLDLCMCAFSEAALLPRKAHILGSSRDKLVATITGLIEQTRNEQASQSSNVLAFCSSLRAHVHFYMHQTGSILPYDIS
jgi:hypothetical protein